MEVTASLDPRQLFSSQYPRTIEQAPAGNTVTPIDVATGRPGPLIPIGADLSAIVFTPDGKIAYVASQAGTTPINVATGVAGTSIPVGGFALAITPDGKTIYLTNQMDNTVIPYDITTGTMGTPISLAGSNPQVEVAYYVAVAP